MLREALRAERVLCSPLNEEMLTVSDKAAVILASLIHPSVFNRLAVAFASCLQRTPTGPAILQPAEEDSD